MLMTIPKAESKQLAKLAKAASQMTADAVKDARDAGLLRRNLTLGDVFWADVANGLALRELPKPPREDYDRRTRMFLDSLRR